MTISIIHCIENKAEGKFERQSKLHVDSARVYQFNESHVFVQPTTNDIDASTLEYLNRTQSRFIKAEHLGSKQKNTLVNYTNKVATCDYLSTLLDTEYMCWIDNDTLFLNKGNLFTDTDKIVVSTFDIDTTTEWPETFDLRTFDVRTQMNSVYVKYFKEHLSDSPAQLEFYVNSWFVYATRTNTIWKEWKDLTYKLLDIIQDTYPDMIDTGLESVCEELALTILYVKDRSRFIDVIDMYPPHTLAMIHTDAHEFDITENTVLFHYTGVLDCKCTGLTGNDFKQDALKIVSTLHKNKKISHLTFINLSRQLQ